VPPDAVTYPLALEPTAPRSGLLARAFSVGRRRPAALAGAAVGFAERIEADMESALVALSAVA
jgi:hypothetical protein